MTTKWVVVTSYQGYSSSLDSKLEMLVGKLRSGSGFGMGWRDIEWLFDSEDEADAASDRLASAGFQSTIRQEENGDDSKR